MNIKSHAQGDAWSIDGVEILDACLEVSAVSALYRAATLKVPGCTITSIGERMVDHPRGPTAISARRRSG